MTITIEKNVPMPEWGANAAGVTGPQKRKYPFSELEVNDSFSIKPKIPKYFQSSVYNLTTRERALGKKFATRSYTDGSVRVWRIK